MDRWDMLIIAVAAYIATIALVRLMAARRDHLVEQVRQQIEQQRTAQQSAARPASEDSDRGAA